MIGGRDVEGKIDEKGYLHKENDYYAACPWQTKHPEIDAGPCCHQDCAAFEEVGKNTSDMHIVQLKCMPGGIKYRIVEDLR